MLLRFAIIQFMLTGLLLPVMIDKVSGRVEGAMMNDSRPFSFLMPRCAILPEEARYAYSGSLMVIEQKEDYYPCFSFSSIPYW